MMNREKLLAGIQRHLRALESIKKKREKLAADQAKAAAKRAAKVVQS